MDFLYVCLKKCMSRFFINIISIFLINISYAAREIQAIIEGSLIKISLVINELLDKKKYKQSIELLKNKKR